MSYLITYFEVCNTHSSLFFDSSSSPFLFLCFSSQEKFFSKLGMLAHPFLTFHSLLIYLHSNPTSNLLKDSMLTMTMFPNPLLFLCLHLIELSAAFNIKHFPFLDSINHKLLIFLLLYRLFFLRLLLSPIPLSPNIGVFQSFSKDLFLSVDILIVVCLIHFCVFKYHPDTDNFHT